MTRCEAEPPALYQVNGTLVRCFLHADGHAHGEA